MFDLIGNYHCSITLKNWSDMSHDGE